MEHTNTEASAQIVLGQPPCRNAPKHCSRLPCVTELLPELLDETVPEDDAPSCSVHALLASQGLFVNDMTVQFAAQLLYELFSTGGLTQHGVPLNLASKRSGPIDIDPRTWERFGYCEADNRVHSLPHR